ncbi:hypothetical protein QOT17_25628 [Balamuthia mandrillaris]
MHESIVAVLRRELSLLGPGGHPARRKAARHHHDVDCSRRFWGFHHLPWSGRAQRGLQLSGGVVGKDQRMEDGCRAVGQPPHRIDVMKQLSGRPHDEATPQLGLGGIQPLRVLEAEFLLKVALQGPLPPDDGQTFELGKAFGPRVVEHLPLTIARDQNGGRLPCHRICFQVLGL